MRTRPWLFVAPLTLVSLLASCAMLQQVADGAGDVATDALLPVAEENKLGKQLSKEVEKELKLHPSDEVQKYVKALGAKVAKGARDVPEGIRFTFKVVDDDKSVNAFAMPGGYIYVYSGLLKRASDEAEVTAVLGHEVAHVTQRHVARRLIAMYGIDAVTKLALGEEPGLLGQIASNIVGTGVMLKYGRDQERDADAAGLPYTARAGWDPNGMVSFFEKLKKDEGSPYLVILQSHPLPSERIANVKALIKAMKKVPRERGEVPYASFRQKL